MANNWNLGNLADIADVVMGQSPAGNTCNSYGNGIPLLNGPTEFGEYHPFPVQFTTDPKKFSEAGDILFCVRGSTTGRMNWADKKYAIGRGIAAVRHKNGQAYYPFLRAVVDHKLAILLAAATGSTFPNVSRKQLLDLAIEIPPLPEQRAIAHILGSLDDKIELNRRMNETLEAMAQALFKSWFIDFDPVIDNALLAGNPIPGEFAERAEQRRAILDQNQPSPPAPLPEVEGGDYRGGEGLPNSIRQLFPSEFECPSPSGRGEGEGAAGIGWIPKGWRVGPLSKIATLTTDSINPGKHPEQIWTHFSIPAFDEGRFPKYEVGKSIKSGKYVVPSTCVLASKLNPQFPRIWLPDVEDENTSICSTEFMPFVPNDPIERAFLYALLCSDVVQGEIASKATGSTGSRQRVKPKEVARMSIIAPPRQLRDVFSRFVDSNYMRVTHNMRSICDLSNLRDTLLPKLLSGELRIPDAEKLVETAK